MGIQRVRCHGNEQVQNAESHHSACYGATRGLALFNRPERRLPTHSGSRMSQEVLPVPGDVLPVHTPPIRIHSLPKDFLALPQGGASRAFTQGHSPCLVSGRFAGNVQLLLTGHSAHGRVDGIPRVRRVYHQLEEEYAMASAPGELLRASPRHRGWESNPIPGEVVQPERITGTIPRGGARDLPHSFQAVGLSVCSASGGPTGPVELETSTELVLSSVCRVRARQTVQQYDCDSTCRGTSRSGPLETGCLRQDRNALGSEGPCAHPMHGCVQHRVGCHPWSPNGQRRLGLLQTHQRPGDRGDLAGSSAFHPCTEGQTCTCVDRQHDCEGCDKSPRRFTLEVQDEICQAPY